MGRSVNSGSPARYADLIAKGEKKSVAAAAAGYARTQRPERLLPVRKALESIATQRERMQGTSGLRLSDSARWYGRASNDKEAELSPRVSARRALDSLLGYDAPKQVQVESRSLLIEFRDLGSDDLRVLREYVSGNQASARLSDEVDKRESSDVVVDQ